MRSLSHEAQAITDWPLAKRSIGSDREHHVTSDPRWASLPLRSDLGFWYTHGPEEAQRLFIEATERAKRAK